MIAKYIARNATVKGLLGNNLKARSEVDGYLSTSSFQYFFGSSNKSDLLEKLTSLNKTLTLRTCLVDDKVTLADIMVYAILKGKLSLNFYKIFFSVIQVCFYCGVHILIYLLNRGVP